MKIVFKLNFFLKIFTLFVLTQALGLYLAYQFLPALGAAKINTLRDFTLRDGGILLGSAVFFFYAVTRWPRFGALVFRVFLTLIIFSVSQAVLGIWLDITSATASALLLVLLFWLVRRVFIQNIVMIIVLAGLGALFGLALTPATVAVILVVLSGYDLVAVYKTGHMIKLAQTMVQARAIFGFVVPGATKDFAAPLHRAGPGENFMLLGSGDVILPLILAVSLVRISLGQAITVVAFACMGLFVMHLIFSNQTVRRPMAALPPIAAFSIIGYLVTLL